ncbi:MAG: transglycosylase domain-containing protein, partial [Syntrophales bacterium]|nr:transglycosylase domain-containing protein [Syntrophales bacterium]
FGIELAARRYFGKAAADLTAMESARLAAVLPNPLKYHPLSDSGYVRKRAERIYGIMVQRGIVIPEYEEVIKEPVIAEGALESHDPAAMKKLETQVEQWKKEQEATRLVATEEKKEEGGGKGEDAGEGERRSR